MAAKELYKNLGTSKDMSLLAGADYEAVGIAVKPGEGVLKAGTVMQKGADGIFVPAATTTMANGMCVILAQEEDTGLEATGVAGSALAYSAGRFRQAKVVLKNGSLTAADLLELRRQGIATDGIGESLDNQVAGG